MGRPIGIKNNSGGTDAPRWRNGNIDWHKVREDHITDIIAGQIAPNTLRGIMYILKSKNILKKSDYNGLTTHCRDWRKQGLIQWNDIIDGSGRGVINDFGDYSTIPDFVDFYVNHLKYGGKNYRSLLNTKWRWYGQPNYVEIWCEKHAIAGTVAALVRDRYVRVAYNKGDPGWKYMHGNCERLRDEMNSSGERRNVYIFYLGDWDRYGRHMDAVIEEQLEYFGLWNKIHFERIGLLYDQVQEYNLPQNFESGEGYEVDALHAFNPQAFKELIHGSIDPLFDNDVHKQILDQHPEKTIDEMIRGKVKFLDEVEA